MNQRKFLIAYAEGVGFDPFTPANWKTVKNTQIREEKVRSQALYRTIADATRKGLRITPVLQRLVLSSTEDSVSGTRLLWLLPLSCLHCL